MRAQRKIFLKGGDWLKDGGQILGGGQVARGGGESAEALCPPHPPPEMETLPLKSTCTIFYYFAEKPRLPWVDFIVVAH